MKTFTLTFKPSEYLRMLFLSIAFVILAVNNWKIWNWQWWVVLVVLVTIFLQVDKRYGKVEEPKQDERQKVIDFFKKECSCMAMDKHIEKLKELK